MILFWIGGGIFGFALILSGIVLWLSRYRNVSKPDPRCWHRPRYDNQMRTWYCENCGSDLTLDVDSMKWRRS